MKLFRRFKYRLRRFIISFISILSIICVTFIPAHAEVLPVFEKGLEVYAQPFVWLNNDWLYDHMFLFSPGEEYTTDFYIPNNEPFGMTFNVDDGDQSTKNNIVVDSGVLHISLSFLTNQYLNPRIPYLSLDRFIFNYETGLYELEGYTVTSDKFNYSSSCLQYSGSGINKIFNFTFDLYVDSKYLPSFSFASFYFYLQRDNSAQYTDYWYIAPQTFSCDILTGADVPKYSQPDDTAKNDLNGVEGELKYNIDSFGSDLGSIFSFDDLGSLVVPGITFWGTTLEDFFNLDFVRPILILSLACGIFALLFGLVGTLVSRSNSKSQSKGNKSKGG